MPDAGTRRRSLVLISTAVALVGALATLPAWRARRRIPVKALRLFSTVILAGSLAALLTTSRGKAGSQSPYVIVDALVRHLHEMKGEIRGRRLEEVRPW